jgi:hypothetical protein
LGYVELKERRPGEKRRASLRNSRPKRALRPRGPICIYIFWGETQGLSHEFPKKRMKTFNQRKEN